MDKIPTIFERAERGGLVDSRVIPEQLLKSAVATEKVDGTNVRLTVRHETLVRVEARRNPTKAQKQAGIVEPWYRDAWDSADGLGISGGVNPADQYIVDAAANTKIAGILDGEYSGEAIGPKIQGNPLDLSSRVVYLFSLPWIPFRYEDVPTDFEGLRAWLPEARSHLNPAKPPEGIVWWFSDADFEEHEPAGKIKLKDFR